MIMFEILFLLRTGKANAISRNELETKTGISDRMIRRYINKLRKEGVPVMSHSDSKGYYIADTEEELKHFLNENEKRSKDSLYINKQVKEGFKRMKQGYPLIDNKSGSVN